MQTEELNKSINEILNARYLVALTGAGVSTDSGIPDFRSQSEGLWYHFDAMEIFSLSRFLSNPVPFYEFARDFIFPMLERKPNVTHVALAKLEKKGLLKALITQNIDLLHEKAGSKNIYELHGNFLHSTCMKCGKIYTLEEVQEKMRKEKVPRCDNCGGVIKPNIVFFEENLPYKVLEDAYSEVEKCDLLLIVGTSLQVYPAAELPLAAKRNGAKLISVNRESTPLDKWIDYKLNMALTVFSSALLRKLQEE